MNLIPTVTLENFKGPLDLLLHLIQQDEIDIYTVEIQSIIRQFLEEMLEAHEAHVDAGAEFLGGASALLLLKSKKLLPGLNQSEGEEKESYISILQELIEYCSFKDMAKKLSLIENTEGRLYPRGTSACLEKPPLSTGNLSIEDLSNALAAILKKKLPTAHKIKESDLLVSQFIQTLQLILMNNRHIPFSDFFTLTKSREELIVSFLALLQLMKEQKAIVTKEYLIQAVN